MRGFSSPYLSFFYLLIYQYIWSFFGFIWFLIFFIANGRICVPLKKQISRTMPRVKNSCWNVSSSTTMDLLVKCQKKIVRIIYVRSSRFPSKELFSEKILPINYLNQYQTLLLTFKMIKNIYRSNIEVKIRENVTNRTTRQSSNFYIPHSSSQAGRNDFFKRGFDNYNRLPSEMKRIRCLEEFKSALKSYLFQKYTQEN